MSAPITGPITRSYNYVVPIYGGCTLLTRSQVWYRQKRKEPGLPLPYRMDTIKVDKALDPTLPGWPGNINAGTVPDYTDYYMDQCVNKCHNKFVDALNEQSMWAVNLVEMKQSLGLVTGLANGLISTVRKVRKFDFVGATREFNRLHESLRLATRRNLRPMSIPKGLKAAPKAFANNWLAYHFGWEPLVKDIGAAIETLEKPFPNRKIVARAQHLATERRYIAGTFWTDINWEYLSKCRMEATVRVNNPNLYLAQQLGFVNPLSVAWELVPFSFVVDWFVNVGQILGQMSEFAGVSVENAYTTRYQVTKTYDQLYYGWYQRKTGAFVRRSLDIAPATLKVRPWKGVSAVRGATAISLLIQQLKR